MGMGPDVKTLSDTVLKIPGQEVIIVVGGDDKSYFNFFFFRFIFLITLFP